MIDRSNKTADKGEAKGLESPKPERASAEERVAFTLYGKGGRAWAERHWNASSLCFNFSTDQPRRK